MNATIRLTPEAHQGLLVTRQTIQAVEILEYGPEELTSFLRDQMARNPLLRLAPAGGVSRMPGARAAPGVDLAEVFAETAPTLRESLQQQLSLLRLPTRLRFLAGHLVESLEDDGLLRIDLELAADLLGAGIDEMEQALRQIQRLEPTGVGARSLRECLTLQLAEQGPISSRMQALLDNLGLLETGQLQRLARLCGIPPGDLPGLLLQLRRLHPRPGHAFAAGPTQLALPDVLVSLTPGDGLRVEVNPELLPRVLIDREYYTELSGQMRAPRDLNYLRGCLQDANLLIRNLDQRAQTTLTVASWIVRHQEGFFRHGARALRPLSQKEIAALAGLHESTVSRAVANRYLLCDRGQFPLKFFFSDRLSASDGGTGVAASVIRQRLQDLIRAETRETVLSDDDLVACLAGEGVSVARRTVAKYRAQLRIPTSGLRRRRLWLDQRPLARDLRSRG